MALCRKISMSEFVMLQSLEFEFTSSKKSELGPSFKKIILDSSKDSRKTNIAGPKLKKPRGNKLFISQKLANSLKKVRLRKKHGKSENNNFLYQKENSVINDQSFKFVKDLPIIPFSPNHLIDSSTTQKEKYQRKGIRLDQLNVCNLEMRRLENLIKEARNELVNERENSEKFAKENMDEDYVDVYDNILNRSATILSNDDYVDMSSFKMYRPRLHSL